MNAQQRETMHTGLKKNLADDYPHPWRQEPEDKVTLWDVIGLLWPLHKEIVSKYPGFFYLCIAVFQVVLIPVIIGTHALLDPGFDKAPFVSNLVSALLWITLTLDIISHVLVIYVFNKLHVFDD